MYFTTIVNTEKRASNYYIVLSVYTRRIATSKIYCFNMFVLIQLQVTIYLNMGLLYFSGFFKRLAILLVYINNNF